ncbi:hypothetical protein [Roseicella sp. DB1501]|uniref:hypothetical protein n=1 Tax=Roseicella sp. DB1501 TaxID=2730925 RepID=UPI00149240DD|nr:hypothetical protein [Roseicella sp. DB1501]NOG73541.1 hypothetical protein [Roseicella sp. DB1501]
MRHAVLRDVGGAGKANDELNQVPLISPDAFDQQKPDEYCGTLKHAQQMVAHSSSRTTKLTIEQRMR